MPSGHSGSSHSSHSSHSSFSSHSSHSSFGGSSRSSFGGSSRSSFGSSSRSSFGSSSRPSFGSSRPSGKSGTSHSSSFSSSRGKPGTPPRNVGVGPSIGGGVFTPRARINQPRRSNSSLVPTIIHCLSHDYAYYPSAWTCDGQTYQAGYYDENGTYYQNVQVENATEDLPVDLVCEYCGTVYKYKWTEGKAPSCENCGAPLTVAAPHTDTVVSDNSAAARSMGGTSWNPDQTATQNTKRKGCLRGVLIGLLVLLLPTACTACLDSGDTGYQEPSGYVSEYTQQGNDGLVITEGSTSQFNDTLYLTQTGDGIWEIGESGEKVLYYSAEDDAWYDEATGEWLWCNTDVTPEVWQYWIEGASEQFGNYGWMECEGDTWYVEVSYGNWEVYTGDTSGFWHIRNSFD